MAKNFILMFVIAYFFGLTACQRSEPNWRVASSFVERLSALEVKELPTDQFPLLKPPDPEVFVRVQELGRPLYVPKRTLSIKSMQTFRCAQCHIPAMTTELLQKISTVHDKISLDHAPKGVLECSRCHAPERMDELRTATGKWVSFDHSYLVCGSCHAKQLMDWAGGAHGKRLQYWHGARIIETCTGCHNPHQPRFPKHWSKTQPAATTKPATTQPQTTQPATQAASPNPPINKGKN